MNCREFWDTMPEPGESAPGHALECPACAARLETMRNLSRRLHALGRECRGIEAPPRVERKLAAAFRVHNGVAPEGPSGLWVPVLTWVAATAIIVILATFLVRERRPEPAQRRATHRVELAVLEDPAESSIYTEEGFVPLPNAARIDPAEEVNLVRVELPRSAMIAVGYAVTADRASETVQAEVVLGADGMARAVKFLEQ
jgi:hypothetical protein